MDILVKEYARQILAVHECTDTSYEGDVLTTIERDLQLEYPDGMQYPISDVAQAIFEICNTDKGYLPPITIEINGDAAHWGLTDLYESVEKQIKEVLDTGLPFITCELASKKEICSFYLQRRYTHGDINIQVWAGMDEGRDLICDAVPNDIILTEEDIDIIYNEYFGTEFEPDWETEQEESVPDDSSLEQILEKVSELWQRADNILKENFNDVEAIVQYYIQNKKEEGEKHGKVKFYGIY